jgi:hypothetical protein
MGRPRKPLKSSGFRGFESHAFRQYVHGRVSGIVADSEVGRVLALVAFVVAFVAEELSADRLVVAATDTEIVVFDAGPGVPHARPTSVVQRVGRSDVRRTSLGLFGEGWDLGGRSVQVATWHRSLIRGWVGEQPAADDTLNHRTRST